ncbi:MAG: hypothetical protein WD099_10465 [Dongiaceae bacterium]
MLDMYGLAALYFQNRRMREGQMVWDENDAMWFAPDGPGARALRALIGVLRGLRSRASAAPRLSAPLPPC